MESTYKPGTQPSSRVKCFSVNVALRVLLFATSLIAVVVMVTSKQTELVPVPGLPFRVGIPAKFNYSPAFIFFVVALSVACLYSIITTLASVSVMLRPAFSQKYLLYLAFWDVLMLGLVASATGASGAVAYIGLKGNDHTGWTEICSIYDKFCRHIGGAIALSFFAAKLLLLLSMLSTYSLYIQVRD